MTPNERRSARLLFGEELAAGTVTDAQLDRPAVATAVAYRRVPSLAGRLTQALALKRGRLTMQDNVIEPLLAAREAVLGPAAAGPPRLLVRVDEFPHYRAWDDPQGCGTDAYQRFHAVLRDADIPYLVAVVPRVPRDPLNPVETEWRPHDDAERAELRALAADGVAFATHGLDHRTRDAHPRRHSELSGLDAAALSTLLDTAATTLADEQIEPAVFVAPYNRFDANQYPALAQRFAVVTGGPESILKMGFHRTPLWRGDAVFLPGYAPFYGTAGGMIDAVGRLVTRGAALWIPVVLHWEWEARDGFAGLKRWAQSVAGLARPWSEFLGTVARADDGARP